MTINSEGSKGAIVTDSVKYKCEYCGGVSFMISTTLDDINDVAGDNADLGLTITGGSIQSLPLRCNQCGHEQTIILSIFDVSASTGTSQVMSNLDSSVLNSLAGLYMIPMVGTDVGKYFIIASNTLNPPTTIILTVAANDDADGIWMITELLPVGLTVAT